MPSLPRRSTKVRQTRLAFTPLPSSSPTAATYSSPVRDRLAGVRYENPSTPSKRRRVESSPQAEPNDAEELNSAALMGTPSTKQTDRDRTSTMLPTPVKSSQVDLIGSLRGVFACRLSSSLIKVFHVLLKLCKFRPADLILLAIPSTITESLQTPSRGDRW